MMSRAAQTQLAGPMRLAGRVFETTDLRAFCLHFIRIIGTSICMCNVEIDGIITSLDYSDTIIS
jgi:hypothetical protein